MDFHSWHLQLFISAILMLGVSPTLAEYHPGDQSVIVDGLIPVEKSVLETESALGSLVYLSSISEDIEANNPSYVHQRCQGFYSSASALYALYLSYPTKPIDPENASTFKFAWNVSAYEAFSKVNILPFDDSVNSTQAYLNTYGGLNFPDTIREHPIFIADKQTCVSYFEAIND